MNCITVTITTLAFAVVVFAIVAFSLWFTIRVALEYHRFNEGIKDWASVLDDSAKDAINRAARQILREVDERITAERNEVSQVDEVPIEEVEENKTENTIENE